MRFAVMAQKGGTGKSSCVLGLADAARRAGISTLVIDLDPQKNASSALFEGEAERTTNDLLALEDPVDRVGSAVGIAVGVSWAAPADHPDAPLDLIAAEAALANREPERPLGYETRLRECLVGADDHYALILIDCPPNLGRLSISGLVAADAALLVTEPAAASIAGLDQVRQTIDLLTANVRGAENLHIAGIVVNKLDLRLQETTYSLSELYELFGDLVLPGGIPVATIVAKAYRAGAPVSAYLPDPAARRLCEAYDQLLAAILPSPRGA